MSAVSTKTYSSGRIAANNLATRAEAYVTLGLAGSVAPLVPAIISPVQAVQIQQCPHSGPTGTVGASGFCFFFSGVNMFYRYGTSIKAIATV